MTRHLKTIGLLFGLLVISLVTATKGQAIGPSNPAHGITITPAFQQASVQAGESQHPISFSVTNNEPKPQTLNLSAADFNTLNESGGLLFVGTNPTELQKKYGLAKWISLPQTQITIAAGQTVVINAAILNLPDLSGGGHYGALLLAAASNSSAAKGSSVSLHPIASSLLFITKLGGDTHKLGLADVKVRHNIFKMPSSVTLRFHNDGNTHLTPRGVVTISGPTGRLVSKGIINDDSGVILPQTFRQFSVPLQAVAKAPTAGHYKLKVDFRFDDINQFRTYQQSFFYLPASLIALAIVIIGIAGLAARRWFRLAKKSKR